MNVFSPPSLYSKTSYSTERPSHLDQLPRSAPPSSLTRNLRLWPLSCSGMLSSLAPVRQQPGPLTIDQQLGPEPAADPVVELAGELIHVFFAIARGGCGRYARRARGRPIDRRGLGLRGTLDHDRWHERGARGGRRHGLRLPGGRGPLYGGRRTGRDRRERQLVTAQPYGQALDRRRRRFQPAARLGFPGPRRQGQRRQMAVIGNDVRLISRWNQHRHRAAFG